MLLGQVSQGTADRKCRLVGGRYLFTFWLEIHRELYPEITLENVLIDSVIIVLFQILEKTLCIGEI